VLEVRVVGRRAEAEDVLSFELQRADGGALPPYSAGAHVDVHLPGGLVRQYSLCSPEGMHSKYTIGVLKEPSSRGGSKALHERVQIGDKLVISEPRNKFPLDVHARRSLLFAGGIGITPILAMADELARDGREFELHYCTRSRGRMAFLERITSSLWAASASLHFDDGAAEQRLDATRVLGAPADDAHVYVCGPAGFMNHVLGSGRTLGWQEARLHREYFVAEPVDHASDKPLSSNCGARVGRSSSPRTSRRPRPSPRRALRFPCHASKGSAAPASRACSRASPTTATSTSPKKSTSGTRASPLAARVR
jgi:vanillate O-demethylase ferredoxin subunit